MKLTYALFTLAWWWLIGKVHGKGPPAVSGVLSGESSFYTAQVTIMVESPSSFTLMLQGSQALVGPDLAHYGYSGILGILTEVRPQDPCGPIELTEVSALVPPVALFHESYACPIEQQIFNVQEAGARAAIIAVNFLAHANGSVAGDLREESSSPIADEIIMPSVLVTEREGEALRTVLRAMAGRHPHVRIMKNPYLVWTTLLTYLSVLFIMLTLCCATYCFSFWCRTGQEAGSGGWLNGNGTLSQQEVEAFGEEVYGTSSEERNGYRATICAICLEEYTENDRLRALPCSHRFHSQCVDPWLMHRRASCPVCKATVSPPETVRSNRETGRGFIHAVRRLWRGGRRQRRRSRSTGGAADTQTPLLSHNDVV